MLQAYLFALNLNIGVVKSQCYPSLLLTGLICNPSSDISNIFKPALVIWNAGVFILQTVFRAGEI